MTESRGTSTQPIDDARGAAQNDACDNVHEDARFEVPRQADDAVVQPQHADTAVAQPQQADAAAAQPQRKDTVRIAGRDIKKGDLVKFISLIVAIIVICGVFVSLWPLVKESYGNGGLDGLVDKIRSSGPVGIILLLVLQFLQVLVAFIPGEAVQFAAGALYGPLLGTLIILVGCALSTAVVYKLVHELGAPFVQSMVSEKYMTKFREFEHSGKLGVLVFILYLIPGLPKDTFSYLVPLTDMKLSLFVGLTTVARIPGVFASCFVASGLLKGSYMAAGIMAGCVVLIVVLCLIFRKPLMELLRKLSS